MASGGPSAELTSLAEYEREVDGILADLENTIVDAEQDFLRESVAVGNVATGWEGTEGRSASRAAAFAGTGLGETERIFSASSVTCGAVVGHADPEYSLPGMDDAFVEAALAGLADGDDQFGMGARDHDGGAGPAERQESAAQSVADTAAMQGAGGGAPGSAAASAADSAAGGSRKRRRPGEQDNDSVQFDRTSAGEEDASIRTDALDEVGGADSASMASGGVGAAGRRSGRARKARRPKGSEDD
ncbi:hypothetical protein FNF27_00686 [Cafeteria roenbergensis]|uniref:Chromatin modification-related protein EAF6 n=1 Tax=Cafeteria roenbergensis TaxID=33653 RepID=A0A5A8CZ42_CAFRO|nr:hypothetical protein FNF29_00006 [Cafeteria roenbergensis]KAA0178138.1 hypothetical protein FNF27_00686 [Cafeteria roenbergensis]|mmetsp:Transcript_14777/g.55702  ORF Transcript_14777/g.55702 Transcript_14777/m.55702 type:complete len:245 (-) Transcript_14777:101-835(-)|eukprot:KAA0157430.1 hypothetical protein FNF29_00006 [Cafeteria roenbergensis]